MPAVRVLGCGGTIASEPNDDGAAPAKSGDDLVTAVPELDSLADISAVDVAAHPGFDMQWTAVSDTVVAAREAVEDGVDGVVVTNGTDTLADTTYALSLLTDLSVPVVVTGSQRRFDEVGSDAPSNLVTAVRTATDDRFSGAVLVAFNDEVHAARDVVKTHTNALQTFQSPGIGPVATCTRASIHHHRDPPATPTLERPDSTDDESLPTVAVVHSGLGVGPEALDRALDAGVDGVVVAGTGLGNTTGALGDAIETAVESVPVVVSSQCHAGPTEPVYGTAGGGVTLDRHGVLWAGTLSTAKARVKLTLALASGVDPETVF